jgi:hypothetical protein
VPPFLAWALFLGVITAGRRGMNAYKYWLGNIKSDADNIDMGFS